MPLSKITSNSISTAETFQSFSTGGVERMRIGSDGRVGIGTTTPTIQYGNGLQVKGIVEAGIRVTCNVNTGIDLVQTSTGLGGIFLRDNAPMAFSTNDVERMRIDSVGNMLFGISSTITGNNTLQVVNAATDSTQIRVRNSAASAGNHWRYGTDSVNTVYIINHNSAGVYINNGGTAWSALSDERMKDIIEPITNATTKVAGLRAVIGKYKTDEEEKRRSFLIAQDVQTVLPEAVSIANQETGHLGLSYTDVIPLLVAAIKEQQAFIDDLKARIEVLEA